MKPEELELKHLSPYLPYKPLVYGGSTFYELMGIIGQYDMGEIFVKVRIDEKYISEVSMLEHSLVLRPLSDIIETIYIDNEGLVPINELSLKLYDKEPESFNSRDSCLLWVNNMIYEKVIKPKGYDDIPHWAFQDLIKWHFDVFGLIKKGLAIDMNKMK